MCATRKINHFYLLIMLLLCCSSKLFAQTDLALNKTVTASTAALPASYAVDGNGATRWGSAAGVDPSWLMVDLGSKQSLGSVVIDWEAANAASYKIEGSTDNKKWTTLATRTGGTYGDRTDVVAVSGSYRYVRMYGTARTSGYGYSIWSFKVYGTGTTSSTATSKAASSIATSKAASSQSTSIPTSGNGHIVVSSNSVRFYASGASWADLHYTINGGAQQNIRMTYNADNTNTYTLSSIPGGAVVRYFFTVSNNNGGAYDTSWAQFTCCSGGTTSTPASTATTSSRAASSSGNSNLPTAYSGYTGVYSGYTLKLDERFDSLNTAVWAKGDGAVGHESMCRFTSNGVQVSNGLLELIVRKEYVPGSWSYNHQAEKGAYNYSCGELRTVPSKRIKYGRIEARMKAPLRSVATGYIGSLFTYVHEGNPREWEEIDVELEGGRPDKMQANLIYGVNVPDWNSTRQWGAWEHKIDTAPVDQWRVFAFEWTPSAMRWYVDGVLVKILDQDWLDCNPSCVSPQVMYTPVPNNLTDLMMNFWIPNDYIQNDFGGNKYGNVYPMVMQYDWVRIYSYDSAPLQNW
ncbi:MAG TPA: discoidin domain-containing protein [Cellvibrio sp.]|nr:discoidin domain-containing protein [Cellvibrio sp.]